MLQSTIDALGLKAIPNGMKPVQLGDKSIVEALTYEDVLISVHFNNGSVNSAKVTPIVLSDNSSSKMCSSSIPCFTSNAVVALQKGEEVDEILGRGGCEKLGVKYDFANYSLSKLVLRL